MNPTDRREPAEDSAADTDTRDTARKPREYGHSSGDRNTRTREGEWHGFEGGDQREAGPDDAAAQRGDRPVRDGR